MNLNSPDLEDCAQLAADFLEKHSAALKPAGGYVLIFKRKAFGWARQPAPEHYRTGVVAFSLVDGLPSFLAVGIEDNVCEFSDAAAFGWRALK